MIAYILAYLDRINVGFAALTMNKDLGLTATQYGFGAGLLFWGYFLFEIPSNLALERFGARRWIARIMFTWGLLSIAAAFATGPTSFVVLRFLLGVAEAGFFPGVIVYLTYWFTASWRARVIAAFTVAIPASTAIGAPISISILHLNGLAGFKGWQWLFILEGIPSILLGFVVLALLTDRPRDATWLTDEQTNWIEQSLASERRAVELAHRVSLGQCFIDTRVLALSLILFANITTNLGLTFFLPQMIRDMGKTTNQIGLISAIPYVLGTIGTLALGYLSDKYNERHKTLFITLMISGVGLAAAGYLGNTMGAIAMLSFAAIGIHGAKAALWPIPSMFLTGSAAAAGIALINSIGNLGGSAGPWLMGWVKDATGTYRDGLYLLAAFGFVAGLGSLMISAAKTRPVTSSSEARAKAAL